MEPPGTSPLLTDHLTVPRTATLRRSFRGLFGREGSGSDRVYAPARSLAAAVQAHRRPATRIAHLARVVSQLDSLFIDQAPADLTAMPSYGRARPELAAVVQWSEYLFRQAARLLHDQLLPSLEEEGFRIAAIHDLPEGQQAWLRQYFRRRVYPLLTPLAVDPGRPFPYISSASLNLLVEMRKPEAIRLESPFLVARVKVPRATPRLIHVPEASPAVAREDDRKRGRLAVDTYVWSVDLVRHFVGELFSGIPVRRACFFHVLRAGTAVTATAEPNGSGQTRRQEYQPVARLDVESAMPDALLAWLTEHLDAPSWLVVRQEYPLELLSLPQLAAHIGGPAAGVRVRV